MKYFKELGIDFYNAKKYSFTINSHDEVKAELRLDSRLEKLITFTSETIDTDNPFSPNQEPQEYYILEALRHSQKNEINHDLPNTSELVQQVADLIKPNAKNRNPNKPQPKSHELVGSGTANRQTGSKELLQQIAELQNQLNQVNAENEHLKKALLQKQVNDENLNSFLFYPSDDTQKDLEQLANHYNKNESEVIQDIFNEQLDDIKPMIEYIQYVGKNNIQDENINRLFDLIKESGQSIKFFSALSKAGFVPRASEPSQSSEIADDKPLHTTEQNAVTKLLYALFSEHNYDLNGAKRGATNDQLVNLTNRHKAGVNKDTIAKWLERANTLKNNLQK